MCVRGITGKVYGLIHQEYAKSGISKCHISDRRGMEVKSLL